MFVLQKRFTPCSDKLLLSLPLIVHRKHNSTTRGPIVIFVHGLGGTRYGTWGNFPKFLYHDADIDIDVGLYEYRTAWRRTKLLASVELVDEAVVLADSIREVIRHGYNDIFFAGHSLGGILVKAAVTELLTRNDSKTLAAIQGIFLMATPQLGSGWAPRILAPFHRDIRVLATNNRVLAHIARVFEDRVASSDDNSVEGKSFLRLWAIGAAEDIFVSSFSRGLGIPSRQRFEGRGSHTSIVKPQRTDDPYYMWVKAQIKDACTTTHPLLAIERECLIRSKASQSFLTSGEDLIHFEECFVALLKSCSTHSIPFLTMTSYPPFFSRTPHLQKLRHHRKFEHALIMPRVLDLLLERYKYWDLIVDGPGVQVIVSQRTHEEYFRRAFASEHDMEGEEARLQLLNYVEVLRNRQGVKIAVLDDEIPETFFCGTGVGVLTYFNREPQLRDAASLKKGTYYSDATTVSKYHTFFSSTWGYCIRPEWRKREHICEWLMAQLK